MIGLWLALVAAGWTQEPPREGASESAPYEIEVWGEAAIRQARAKVVRELESQGYRFTRTNGRGELVFRPPKAWKGKVFLARDGLIRFGRPVVAFAPPPESQPMNERAQTDTMVAPANNSARVSFVILPTKARLRAVQSKVLDRVEPSMRELRSVIQQTAFQQTLSELPDRLDALWASGVPLDGATDEAGLATPEARRAAVLDYWATRPDTGEGAQVCAAVEVWLREVVQTSPNPVTAAEAEGAEARAAHGRALGLDD